MSYAKRNLTIIAILLTILILLCIYLVSTQIFLLIQSQYQRNSNTVYSKAIPIQEQSEVVKTVTLAENLTDVYAPKKEKKKQRSILQLEMEQVEKEQEQIKRQYTTQKQVLQANKENIWRIQIPKLGLDAHIEEGTDTSTLLEAVGHLTNTATWNGNVCLAGHNRGYLCNFFSKVKNLKIGDEIIYYTKQGKRIYQVQTNKVILETDWSYTQKTEDNRITLITCEENRGEYRRCIQAMQIAEKLNVEL